MILLKINPKSRKPVFKQIADELVDMIGKNVLKVGERLPSSRKLADQLGVNRTTVYKAYEELWSKGFTESKPGSYSIIRKRTDVKSLERPSIKKIIDWEKRITPKSMQLYRFSAQHSRTKPDNENIDFATLSPDPRIMPYERFRKCLNQVLIEEKESLLTYSDPQGYKPLRKFVTELMRGHSVHVSEDEVLLTNGCQNGIELLLKLLVNPTDKIITECPTYSSAFPLFKHYAKEVICIPMDENGMNLQSLETTLKKEHPALLYTIPNFHNPTGLTSSQVYREELLKICERNKLPLLEDGFSEEMKYTGKNILPIKSMDKYNLVFYLGTFSKVLFPGLRIGWIAADKECINHLSVIKHSSELSGFALTQAALYKFCSEGYYELHIKKMHNIYKKRMHTAINALKEFIPVEKFSFTKPFGGYTIWLASKRRGINEEDLMQKIFNTGVSVSKGSIFFPTKSDKACFRISIARADENEIVEGIKRLGKVLTRI
jgi:DNA-binding transcriptional MocR family regulator